ncbi:MAG: hypothetical protein J6C55_02660 [Oscillospiraceae bacterium]|nr:hypothetical protein [Oscillospiraceae bacterium]
MFLKLVKTDFKYHSRSFFMVVMSVLLANILMLSSKGLVLSLKESESLKIVKTFLIAIAVMFLIIAVFGTIVMITKVFNNKCVSSESYLTYSLPVKRYYHIWSNLIISTVWSVIILVLSGLSAMLWIYVWSGKDSLVNWIRDIQKMFFSDGFSTFSCIFTSICGVFSGLFLIYLCISVVNTSVLKHRPLMMGVLAYIVIFYFQNKVISEFLKFCQNYFDLDCLEHTMAVNFLISGSVCIVFGIIYYILLLHTINKKLEVD